MDKVDLMESWRVHGCGRELELGIVQVSLMIGISKRWIHRCVTSSHRNSVSMISILTQ